MMGKRSHTTIESYFTNRDVRAYTIFVYVRALLFCSYVCKQLSFKDTHTHMYIFVLSVES